MSTMSKTATPSMHRTRLTTCCDHADSLLAEAVGARLGAHPNCSPGSGSRRAAAARRPNIFFDAGAVHAVTTVEAERPAADLSELPTVEPTVGEPAVGEPA